MLESKPPPPQRVSHFPLELSVRLPSELTVAQNPHRINWLKTTQKDLDQALLPVSPLRPSRPHVSGLALSAASIKL